MSSVAGIIVLVILVYVFTRILLKPFKILWKLILNSGMGLLLLIIVNYIGQYFDFSLPLNIVNILIAGFLGIPGIIILLGMDLYIR